MNCKNCGAPVVNGYCEYCGTDYGRAAAVSIVMNLKTQEMQNKIEELKLEMALTRQRMLLDDMRFNRW